MSDRQKRDFDATEETLGVCRVLLGVSMFFALVGLVFVALLWASSHEVWAIILGGSFLGFCLGSSMRLSRRIDFLTTVQEERVRQLGER